MKKGERTYKVLDEIQIDFLAGCPVPAQAGATALLMKPSSSFADTRHAVAILRRHGEGYRERSRRSRSL